MGIGNSRGLPHVGRSSTGSLPLMGIGNSIQAHHRSKPISPHYPSWGLETRRSRLMRCSCVSSLPLMGIGNHADLQQLHQAGLTHYPSWGLETLKTSSRNSFTGVSLPLMGIGNIAAAAHEPAASGLITPHGDWKPFCSRAIVRDVSDCSLPLMGIGNGGRLSPGSPC